MKFGRQVGADGAIFIISDFDHILNIDVGLIKRFSYSHREVICNRLNVSVVANWFKFMTWNCKLSLKHCQMLWTDWQNGGCNIPVDQLVTGRCSDWSLIDPSVFHINYGHQFSVRNFRDLDFTCFDFPFKAIKKVFDGHWKLVVYLFNWILVHRK